MRRPISELKSKASTMICYLKWSFSLRVQLMHLACIWARQRYKLTQLARTNERIHRN